MLGGQVATPGACIDLGANLVVVKLNAGQHNCLQVQPKRIREGIQPFNSRDLFNEN